MPDGDGTLGASREFVQITAAMRTGVLGAVGAPTAHGALAGVPELLSCCQGQLSEQLSEPPAPLGPGAALGKSHASRRTHTRNKLGKKRAFGNNHPEVSHGAASSHLP